MPLSPAEKQKRYRERRAAAAGNASGNAVTRAEPVTVTPVTREAKTSKSVISEARPLEAISGAGGEVVSKPVEVARVDPGQSWSESGGNTAILERKAVSVQISDKPRKRGTVPESLANLRPAWRDGESGNAKGRPSAGLVIREWWNALASKGEAEWRRVADDAAEPGAKRIAAKRLLDGLDGDGNGRGAAIEQVVSHTAGKAPQVVEMNTTAVTVGVQVVATDADFIALAQRFLEKQRSSDDD